MDILHDVSSISKNKREFYLRALRYREAIAGCSGTGERWSLACHAKRWGV